MQVQTNVFYGGVLVAAAVAVCLCLGSPTPAMADDATIVTSFDGVGPGQLKDFEHEEDPDLPHKGWAFVTITNNSPVNWTDFHVQIFEVNPSWSVENIDIVNYDPYKPTTDRSPFTYLVDNVVVGSTLDYYFASDPILPGQTGTFNFYTDNTTDNRPFFGIAMYPTPEPATMALLGIGSLLLLRRRR